MSINPKLPSAFLFEASPKDEPATQVVPSTSRDKRSYHCVTAAEADSLDRGIAAGSKVGAEVGVAPDRAALTKLGTPAARGCARSPGSLCPKVPACSAEKKATRKDTTWHHGEWLTERRRQIKDGTGGLVRVQPNHRRAPTE